METFEGLVRRIVNSFNAIGLDYVFTGALAASYYGFPRTTMDIDVIVKVARGEAHSRLAKALKEVGLEVDEKKIDATLESAFRIATFRDNRSPFTVDIIFSNKKLEKRTGTILGLPTFYQPPEELILSKLRMIKATIPRERALKDEEDVRAILKFTRIDMALIRRQAQRSNTLSILENIVANMKN